MTTTIVEASAAALADYAKQTGPDGHLVAPGHSSLVTETDDQTLESGSKVSSERSPLIVSFDQEIISVTCWPSRPT